MSHHTSVSLLALTVISLLATASLPAAGLEIPTTSPPGFVRQRVGATDVEISYSRPLTRGREIFGVLVPYDEVWRTGANTATRVTFSTAVTFGGTAVPAGTYELFTIPGPAEWTVILQANHNQWGSYAYDPANDVARVTVRPQSLADVVESLTIAVDDVDFSSARFTIAWARTRVAVPLAVDVVGVMVPHIEVAMAAEGPKPYFAAAMFYYEHDLDLAQAETWMRAALANRPDHIGMLHRLALILAKRDKRDEAIAVARKSRELAQAAGPELRDEYTRLNDALLATLGAP